MNNRMMDCVINGVEVIRVSALFYEHVLSIVKNNATEIRDNIGSDLCFGSHGKTIAFRMDGKKYSFRDDGGKFRFSIDNEDIVKCDISRYNVNKEGLFNEFKKEVDKHFKFVL